MDHPQAQRLKEEADADIEAVGKRLSEAMAILTKGETIATEFRHSDLKALRNDDPHMIGREAVAELGV